MAAKSEKASAVQRQLTVQIPPNGYRRCLFATHFRVDWIDQAAVITFGFLGGGCTDQLAVAVPKAALAAQRSSFETFIGRIGSPDSPNAPLWQQHAVGQNVELVDMLHMSSGDMCEIVMLAVAMRAMPDAAAPSSAIQAIPVALVRCNHELLKHLVHSLYPAPK
jgi:hypothetical protein